MELGDPKTKIIEPFSQDWFRQRAIDLIQKTAEGYWDFSDSLLLYAASGVEVYEDLQKPETEYARLVTQPERAYLESIADAVVTELPDDFDYIDLGPGTEHKEQFLFVAAKRAGKTFRYFPVDVSENYLALAQEYAQKQGIEVLPMRASFEDLVERLPASEGPRFVSLGLTFTNYEPQVALKMLRKIAGVDGRIFIDVQIRERSDMAALQKAYETDAKGVVETKLPFVGLDGEGAVEKIETDAGIQFWCTVKTPSPQLVQKGMQPGDRILMLRSLRYRFEEFETELVKSGSEFTLLDQGSSFVGAVLQCE